MPDERQQRQYEDWSPPAPLNPHGRWHWDRNLGWVWRPDYNMHITDRYSPFYYPSDDEIWDWMCRGWTDYTMRHGFPNL